MGRHRRSSVALAVARALGIAAAIMLVIDFAHPVARLNVAALALLVLAAVAYLRYLFIHVHETAVETARQDALGATLAEEHVEQRLRGLRTNADSDH